jgi:Flp pilus assembly protein TadB
MTSSCRPPRTMGRTNQMKGTNMDDDGLGAGFWLKMIGVIFAIGIGGLVLFVFIGAAWYAWGLLGMFVFVVGVLALVAWIYDRQHAKRYEDLETE